MASGCISMDGCLGHRQASWADCGMLWSRLFPRRWCLSLPGCGLQVSLRLLPLKVISNSQEAFRGSVFYLNTQNKAWCALSADFHFVFIGASGVFSNARSPFLPGSLSFLPSCSPQAHPAAPCPAPPWIPAAWSPLPLQAAACALSLPPLPRDTCPSPLLLLFSH